MSTLDRQVAITGFGLFSPIGIGVDQFLASVTNGVSGVAPIQLLSYSASPDNAAGEVSDFTESTAKKVYLKKQRKSIKVMCREIQLGVASALQAVQHANLELDGLDRTRVGVEFGADLMSSPPEVLVDAATKCVDEGDSSQLFHFDRWGQTGMPAMEPLWLLCYLPNMPACHIGIAVDAQGPNNSLTMDEASGGVVIGEAFRVIRRGSADVMITGTTGSRVHATKAMQARLWDELATEPDDPTKRCRPFDADRKGEVIAEGSGALVLEEESHANGRGATVYGRVLGWGSSCAVDDDRNPDMRTALRNAMHAAISSAGLETNDIGHVNAHGCGSTTVDVQESQAIHDVFGEAGTTVPVTSIKSYMGNAMSGGGVLELAASVLSLRQGFVPRTLNYETPDSDCPLNVVHGEPLATDNRVVLKTSVTRMGQASAVVVEATA